MTQATARKLTIPSAVDYTFGKGNVIVLNGARYLVVKVNPKSYVVANEKGDQGTIARQANDDKNLPIEAEKDFTWLGRLEAEVLPKHQMIVVTEKSQWAGVRGKIERVNPKTYTISLDGEEGVYLFDHRLVRAI